MTRAVDFELRSLARVRSSKLAVGLALVALDLLAVFVAFVLTIEVRAYLGTKTQLFQPLQPGLEYYLAYWPILILWPLIYWREGLYPGLWMTADEELKRLIQGTTMANLLVITLTFITQTGVEFSRPVLIGWWLTNIFLIPVNHIGAKFLMSVLGLTGPPIIIVGLNSLTERILEGFAKQNLPSFSPVAIIAKRKENLPEAVFGVPVFSPMALEVELASMWKIDTAMIVLPEASGEEIVSLAEDLNRSFKRVLIVPDLHGLSTVQTDVRDMEGLLALEVRSNLLSPFSQAAKRGLELVLIAFIAIPILPILSGISLALLLEREGPIFFGHQRIGKGGEAFTAWKFRTMVKQADEVLARAIQKNSKLRLEWERSQKLKNDPRMTKVGRLLRRFSLDELPQLWNVIRKDMSLVGPRPIVAEEIEKFGRAISLYYQVRPGISGLWQVSGRSDLSYDERIRLDSYYVRNWSVWLDLVILLRTTLAVVSGRGAY